ncbi:Fanconi anemia core complex-associated protein 20 [Melopsittacus undulatus]|uniref:Fanconi anemia core complex-associated protein 20 n=1 Tax=Melopsittacus undulatus TaxID=13146 RepID=UPI00146A8D6C|nr:Fanconi anemia core complex-associated protein 20 [Melopsittacus undulatus]
MSEEGAAKLRLKGRKEPAAWSREHPRQRQSLTHSCSWFEKEDLNECEEPWALLLKGISQDAQCADWQAVPSFPEFFTKSSKEESPQEQEVFTAGKKDFPWVSFPSFCKQELLNPEDLSSYQLTQSQVNHLHKGQGQADKLSSLLCAAEKTYCVTITDQAKHVVGEDTEAISKPDVSPKSCKLTWQRSSVHHLALPQCSVEALSHQQHCRGTAQNTMENGEENNGKELQLQTHQGDVSFAEARFSHAEENPPLSSVPQTKSCKEETENQGEGAPILDSCPMCRMCFSGTLSQLDIDEHLAMCLSESTDDVMW